MLIRIQKGVFFFIIAAALCLATACEGGKGDDNKQAEAPKAGTATSKTTEADNAPKADPAQPEVVKQTLEHLFEICKGGDFSQAAELLVYRGADKKREWKSVFNYDTPDEKLEVDKICSKILVLLNGISSHEFVDFVQETEREGTWNIWILRLKYQDQTTDQKAFAFLRIGKAFALGDID